MLAKAGTIDVSEGGTYLTVAQDIVDNMENINVTFSIPSTAPNHQIEGFAGNATVLRKGAVNDEGQLGLALRFTQQMHLPLDT
jgi:hypothetical protein